MRFCHAFFGLFIWPLFSGHCCLLFLQIFRFPCVIFGVTIFNITSNHSNNNKWYWIQFSYFTWSLKFERWHMISNGIAFGFFSLVLLRLLCVWAWARLLLFVHVRRIGVAVCDLVLWITILPIYIYIHNNSLRCVSVSVFLRSSIYSNSILIFNYMDFWVF